MSGKRFAWWQRGDAKPDQQIVVSLGELRDALGLERVEATDQYTVAVPYRVELDLSAGELVEPKSENE